MHISCGSRIVGRGVQVNMDYCSPCQAGAPEHYNSFGQGKFSDLRISEITSAGISGTIQQALVWRSWVCLTFSTTPIHTIHIAMFMANNFYRTAILIKCNFRQKIVSCKIKNE